MAGILHITTVYRQGMSDDREAMKQLFQCEDAQKIACSVFLRYKKKLQYVDWDIVLTDAIVRYMERLIREKEHDVKPIEKPAAVFWLICNQICWMK